MNTYESKADTIKVRPYIDEDYEAVKRNLEEGTLFDPTLDTQGTLATKIRDRPESILVATVNDIVVGSVYIIEDHLSFASLFKEAIGSGVSDQR